MRETEPVVLIGPGWPFKGGIASHTTHLYRAFRDLAPVLFISLRSQYPPWLYPGGSDRSPEDRSLFEPETRHLLSPLSPFAWWRAARAIANFQPKHIVIPWWHVFWTPMICALLMLLRRWCPDARIVFVVHNAIGHDEHRLSWRLARTVLRRGDIWLVHARSEGKKLRAMLGNVPVHYQTHPAYPCAGEQLPGRASARAQLSLADGPTLLFFGYVRPYKGLDTLLEALALLDNKTRCQLVVAGEIWGDPRIWYQLSERLGVSAQVRFENHYIAEADVPLYFAAADLVVLPYRSATGSGVVRLAHSHGRPALVTRTGALPDSVEDGTNGLIVPTEDPEALAQAIRLFFDGTCRRPMEQAARDQIQSDDWHRLAKTILQE